MPRKRGFVVRMYDVHNNQREEAYPAATAAQALQCALHDPLNFRYDDFGLIGEDGRCHIWEYRHGRSNTPRGRTGSAMREAIAGASATPRAPVLREPTPLLPSVPQIIGKPEKERLFIAAARALSQVSRTETFTARSFKMKLPLLMQPFWIPSVWPHVLGRLMKEHAIMKVDHFNYRRVEGYVAPKLDAEPAGAPEPVPAPVVSAVASEDCVAGAAGNAALPTCTPPPSTDGGGADIGKLLLSVDEKADAVLLLAKVLLSDTRERRSKFDHFGTRILEELDRIETLRSELEAFIRDEDSMVNRISDVVSQLRHTQAPPVSAAGGAH